ncbi:MAG: outer membrane protein assembly factor BamA [Sphingobacteriaceae bacterium]|nr:outer membrane protein assembly factor BamA [Sphingobacteriaceae bacterium]
MNRILLTLLLLFNGLWAFGQFGRTKQPAISRTASSGVSYLEPKEYIVGGTTVKGAQYLDAGVLVTISKLTVGEKVLVPGDATANAVKNLWDQGLLDDVKLNISDIRGDSIFFELEIVERPRVSKFELIGLKKSEIEAIQEKIKDKNGKIINDNLYNTVSSIIKKHFTEKGYLYTEVAYKQQKDTVEANSVVLRVRVDKHNKVKVHHISIAGNTVFTDSQIRKLLKKTRQQAFYKLLGTGKFTTEKFESDKEKLISKLQERGYRDARLVQDSIAKFDAMSIEIFLTIYEGPKYYFGNLSWSGNAKYSADILQKVLSIKKGEIFSDEKLNKKLTGSANGDDVSALYLNDGYLTFNVDPVQTKVHQDTIDIEFRVYEGPQYTISKVSLKGNDITNDRVVLREIRTKPGQKFSKEAVIRTTREIAQLGNFDEQKTDVKPIPNPADGTVDIEYTVSEKPSDQIELSGGFGGGRIIGTLGLTFNNFSARNIFNGKAWKPLPKGDGQKLSIRGQTNGKFYQSYSFSFSEPWLGGKKPVNFGISAFTSLQSNGLSGADPNLQKIRMNGITFSLGQRLKWPDDYFQLVSSINLQQYILRNYADRFIFSNGKSYNFNLTQQLSRNSVDAPIYPTSGSHLRFTLQLTPPYSLFNKINYVTATDQDRYRYVEYHKWKFDAQWYQRIYGKLIFKAQAQFGFLGSYNKAVGQSPFERYKLGGDGMQGFDFLQGSEIIGMRGYQNNSVIPVGSNPKTAQGSGSPIYNKYVLELRHPITLSQQATVFVLAFAEGGNTWNNFKQFSPFNVRRSAGFGARIFLPIFGLLGLDYGYGFDSIPGIPGANGGQFHFSIAQQMGGGF